MKALLLNEAEVWQEHSASQNPEFDKTIASKKIYLKASKLNADLLAYLRAHLLLKYDGDLSSIKVTEPTAIDYELLVLQTYRSFIEQVAADRNTFVSNSLSSKVVNAGRRWMIETYK